MTKNFQVKSILCLAGILLACCGLSHGEENLFTPTLVPQPTSTPPAEESITWTPTATPTFIVNGSSSSLETPTPISSKPEMLWTLGPATTPVSPINREKPSKWVSSTGLGIGLPGSGNIQKAYGPAFAFDLGSGYLLSNRLSLWLNVGLDQFSSKNDSLTNGNNYMVIGAAFLIRARLLLSDFSPYFFLGPGLAYNENRSDNTIQYDSNTGYSNVPINSYEFDFLAEGGLGFQLKAGEGIDLYLEGKLIYDFASSHFAGTASTDSPDILIPLEMGVIFGY